VSEPEAADAPRTAAPSDAPPGEKTDAEVARTAGRGGLAVAFAKIYFIGVGLVQQVALKHVLGLDGFGALSSALSVASITYNPIVSTSIQGVSRAVAQARPDEQPATVRRTFLVHAGLSAAAAAVFLALAPIVGRTIGAPHVVAALQLLSAILLLYGLYTPLVGVLNGRKKFTYQAGLDILAATLRTIGLVAGGYFAGRAFGLGVEGAVLGFIAGATIVLFVALSLVGIGRSGPGGPTVRAHLAFIAPLLFGQVLLNLLLQADLTLLRSFASRAAADGGLTLEAADPLVGAYRATQLFCFLPYQLLLSVTFILFPMLAEAHKSQEREAVARYVKTGVRLALVIAGAMVSVTSGLAAPLLRLVFGADTAGLAAQPMQLLSIGFGAFAIFGILTTVLNSLGRERASAILTLSAVVLVAALCFAYVRGEPFGAGLLWRTALATSTGLFFATVGAAWLVRTAAGAVVSPLSLGRVVAALAGALVFARFLPAPGKVMTIAYAAAIAVVYFALLVALRELGGADLRDIKLIVARRRGASGS
jgi:stage V sporulation protein B